MMKKLGYGLVAALCLGTFANVFALTQEESAKQFAEAVQSGDAKKVVALFPDSYVKDVNKVIQAFAGKMDEELWQKGRETVALAVDVLAVQSENALGGVNMTFANMNVSKMDEEAKKSALKELAKFIRSDATELKALKKGDVTTLVSGLMPVFAKFASDFKAADKDNATSDDTSMKQVEGKWVTAEMADGWKEKIDSTLKGIQSIDFTSEEGKAQKAQLITLMDSMKPVLKKMESAKTPEEFQSQIMMLMMPIMMMQMQMSN